MTTFESLRKDILRLQVLVILQSKRIKELEKYVKPISYKECGKCEGLGFITMVGKGSETSNLCCPDCRGMGHK